MKIFTGKKRRKMLSDKYDNSLIMKKRFLLFPKKRNDEIRWLSSEILMYEFSSGAWGIVDYWFDEIEENFYESWKKDRTFLIYLKDSYSGFKRRYSMDKIIKIPRCIRKKLKKIEKETDIKFKEMKNCRDKLEENPISNKKLIGIAEKIKNLTYKI